MHDIMAARTGFDARPLLNEAAPCVILSNVSVHFDGRPVLRECNLTLQGGLIHGIVGIGGSGRSTILKVIGTVIPADSGLVQVLGQDLAGGDENAVAGVRSRIGFQFQNLALFDSLNVIDNVLFAVTGGDPDGADREDRERAIELLTSVGLGDFPSRQVGQLSGGMQRRLAIARAFAPRGAIIHIFDDPVAGLDPVTSSRILRLIADRCRRDGGLTAVISTHEIAALLPICDIVHVLHDGLIHFSGTPAQALECDLEPVARLFRETAVVPG